MLDRVKKFMGATMLAGMMVCTVGGITTYANNNVDTNFSFQFQNKQSITPKRAKTDTSKMYMKCTSLSSGASYTAHAVAYKSYSASDKVAIDCSAGKTYLFDSIGKHRYMTNLVKERGYSIGAIAANPNYGYKFSAAGVWSPDNVNKY